MSWVAWNYLALGFSLLALLAPVPGLRRGGHLLGAWSASLLVLIGGVQTIITGAAVPEVDMPLAILPGFSFTLDPMRALFLMIAATVYGLSVAFVVHDARRYPDYRARLLPALTALLFAAMVAILLAGAVTSFVFAWEIMSLVLWALISFDNRDTRHVHAAYVTLAFSEAGALAALAGLLVLAHGAGTLSLAGIAAAAGSLSPSVLCTGFLLTFFGFGVKSGIVPVNVWMSDAYAAAPRSLSPLFSGATLNLGVFALWIIDGPLARQSLLAALIVLVTGAVTAILGIVYALTTRSLTRVLTNSSIENLGIVVAASGAGFAFAALDRPVLAGLALVAGLYHMVNHSAYKTLLFLGAGGIHAAVGTDDMDALGGLLKRLPVFGSLFLLGTYAIAALPPFNGFVSEWLTLESFLRVVEVSAVPVRITFALAGALLALTAGLALTCFVMVAGSTLLGLPRSRAAVTVGSMPLSVTLPMGVLVVVCLGLGVLVTAVIPVLGHLAAPQAGADASAALVPAFFTHPQALAPALVTDLTHIGAQIGRGVVHLRGLVVLHSGGETTPVIFAMSTALSFAVIAGLLLVVWGLVRGLSRRRLSRRGLWDGGLVRLHPEMTYTATAFASPVRVLFDQLLRPVVEERAEQHGAFVTARHRRELLSHVVERLAMRPVASLVRATAAGLARLHHGPVTAYAAYVLAVLVATLVIGRVLF
jgi:hydrogenase-4 component B